METTVERDALLQQEWEASEYYCGWSEGEISDHKNRNDEPESPRLIKAIDKSLREWHKAQEPF